MHSQSVTVPPEGTVNQPHALAIIPYVDDTEPMRTAYRDMNEHMQPACNGMRATTIGTKAWLSLSTLNSVSLT